LPRHPKNTRVYSVKISRLERPNGGSRFNVTLPKRIINEIQKDPKHRPRYGLYEMGFDQHTWIESKNPYGFRCPHCGKKISPKDVIKDE
jgi:hypothetical protein